MVNAVDCCNAKGVDSDCIGLCKPLDYPEDYDNIHYPNFCDLFKTEVNTCWKELHGTTISLATSLSRNSVLYMNIF